MAAEAESQVVHDSSPDESDRHCLRGAHAWRDLRDISECQFTEAIETALGIILRGE
jgi:hypothetical protein